MSVESSALLSSSLCLWCNGVSVGIPPLSPIFRCKYIPDQWTTECSAPVAAAAEVLLSIDKLYDVCANAGLYGYHLSWKYMQCESLAQGSLLSSLFSVFMDCQGFIGGEDLLVQKSRGFVALCEE